MTTSRTHAPDSRARHAPAGRTPMALVALLLLGAGPAALAADQRPADPLHAPAGATRIQPVAAPAEQPLPDWVPAMRRVHARFQGRPGTFAQFGDSITVSRAFWTALQWNRKNEPPEVREAFALVHEYMKPECWDGKGPEQGNQGRMTIRWAHENIDRWLRDLDPEAAVLMFGTNDIGRVPLDEYETKTREVLEKCLANGTVVILSTIPPKHGRADQAAQYAEVCRRIAHEMKLPLVDYHAEILRRRPDDWDGAAEKFHEYQGYQVPTLISRDGVHPSNPKEYVNDFSAAGLRSNGFNLRNYQVLLRYAEVIRWVLEPESGPM